MQFQREGLILASFLSAGEGHLGAWRQPDGQDASDIGILVSAAKAAEAGLFDLVLVGDVKPNASDPVEMNRAMSRYDVIDPFVLISALAMETDKLGLAATASTTYELPYHIARRMGSIDKISQGRAAWNIVTTMNPGDALHFGLEAHPHPEERYARAEEFVDVVTGLWDSWTSGAFIRDKATGHYFDANKLRKFHHRGQYFNVDGPLDVARSPQGRPVLVQAGSSAAGKRLGARVADILFTSQQFIDTSRVFMEETRALAGGFGRPPGSVKVVTGITPFIAPTKEEARAKFDSFQRLIPVPLLRGRFNELMGGIDFNESDWSRKVSDLGTKLDSAPGQSRKGGVVRTGIERDMTLEELARWSAGTRGHVPLMGTPTMIADHMESWFRAGACDGFIILPHSMPNAIEEFGRFVVPELQRRGIFHDAYGGHTLREGLGLPPIM